MKISSIAFLALFLKQSASALTCDQIEYCVDCVDKDGCVWTADTCLESCDIADAGCYDSNTFPDKNGYETCLEAGSVRCEDNLDCLYCLEGTDLSCAWTGGQCLPGCDLADAACYSALDFNGMTGFDICVEAGDIAADYNPCAELVTCDFCLGGALDCVWNGVSCDRECEADGICYARADFPDMTVTDICALEGEGPPPVPQDNCNHDGIVTCMDCLTNPDGDCAWIGAANPDGTDGCRINCAAIPDNTCYSPEVLPNQDAARICELAGAGPEDVCAPATSCNECLNNGCSWIGAAGPGGSDACFASCSDVPDNTCYSPEVLENMGNSEICELAGEDPATMPADDVGAGDVEDAPPVAAPEDDADEPVEPATTEATADDSAAAFSNSAARMMVLLVGALLVLAM